MGMYHENRFVGPGYKRHIKRCTSREMRKTAKESCREEFTDKITLTGKSHNLYGMDVWIFS